MYKRILNYVSVLLLFSPILPVLMTACKKTVTGSSKSLIPLSGVRYKDEVFANAETPFLNYAYRVARTFGGADTTLKLDVYQPAGDTVSLRPAVVFIHGGAFTGGSEKDAYAVSICTSLAKRGYVAISIGYRLGSDYTPPLTTTDSITRFYDNVYRANQDCRAAVRFVRKNSSAGRIDTNRIFIAGVSAGAGNAIDVAYVDQGEIPLEYSNRLGLLDGQGLYDFPGYSTLVRGVVNMEGAILDTSYIDPGDAPLISFYGDQDQYYKDSINGGSPPYHFFNGQAINARTTHLGILTTPIITYPGVHGATTTPTNLPLAMDSMSAWLYSRL